MATEELLDFSVASMVENVLHQHGKRLNDIDLASRKAEEASLRRYEAAGWLRKAVGVVGGKDLPAEPSEEDFRLGLRSGIILCNVLNKVQPGAVQKVVEMPCDSVNVPDGAALSAYQYFENVRNFLVAIEEMGLPTFEASDLEQGGKASRVVNCVLALKSYSDWKQGGANGSWKFGNVKAAPSGKQFVLRNSEPFMNSVSRTSSMSDKTLDRSLSEQLSFSDLGLENSEMCKTPSLNMLVRELLLDKKQEDIPIVVENMLSKVMEEFEHRLATQNGQIQASLREKAVSGSYESPMIPSPMEIQASLRDKAVSGSYESPMIPSPMEMDHVFVSVLMVKMETRTPPEILHKKCCDKKDTDDGISDNQKQPKQTLVRQLKLVEKQHTEIQVLKSTIQSTKADLNLLQMKYNEEVSNLGTHLRSLAHAASGYQRVLEENRKLYNQVQDLKGNIRVYCRVRPVKGQSNELSSVDHIDDGSITIITPSKYGKEGRKSFTFNKAFGPSASQAEVFADTQPLIRSVLDGYNVCIFAYGQTGSGKTHTMTGPDVITEKTMGVNYRALSDLFMISDQRKDTISYDISVQMIEIYNEQVRDLLVADEIRNSSQNGLNVPDANLVPVKSTSGVISLMNLGQKNRAVGSTAMNDRSSRSHSCLTVHVQGKNLSSGALLRGCMHLVDLAGSERVDKTEAVGERLKEAQHINKSLSALGDVISSLAQKNSHVPYRNSKLTQLLQDSLGGQAKTLMFVHIAPEHDAIGETISTLKFAERVSSVELGAARANKENSDVKELKEQIASLKAALARKEGEPVRLQYSGSSSPERFRLKSSAGSSPSRSSWQSSSISGDHKQQIEDMDNLEIMNNCASKPKRKSLDLQDLLMNSPPWLPVGSPGLKDDEKERDWVDKVMVIKQEGGRRDNTLGSWEEESRQLPDMFYHKQNSRNQMVTDDSDELEATTSDSSEQDFLWQPNVHKVTNVSNSTGSKLKKPSPKQVKSSPEIRSLIPAPPSRRLSNGINSPITKAGKQALSSEAKRKAGNSK
ncbi:kinesin-like protein KIN-14F [Coffea eugenioides]|uniref:kinesin-like protein KIN-14F n=1 Tax=Coffea eugenioides TaxID=49369 RepID=UPI000F614AFA|nr:kinesin-like protein KIN-14F [Coffea eugenioides]